MEKENRNREKLVSAEIEKEGENEEEKVEEKEQGGAKEKINGKEKAKDKEKDKEKDKIKDKNKDKDKDKPKEKDKEKPKEKEIEKAKEKSKDKGKGKAKAKGKGKTKEKTKEKAKEKSKEKAKEKTKEKAKEKSSQKAKEKSEEKEKSKKKNKEKEKEEKEEEEQEEEEMEEDKTIDEEDDEKDSSQNGRSSVVEKTYMGSSSRKKRQAPENDDSKQAFDSSLTLSQRNMRSHTIDIIYDNPHHRVFPLFSASFPAALRALLAAPLRQPIHHSRLLPLQQVFPQSLRLGAFLPFPRDNVARIAARTVDLLALPRQPQRRRVFAGPSEVGNDVCGAIRRRDGATHAEVPAGALLAAAARLSGSEERAMEPTGGGCAEHADEQRTRGKRGGPEIPRSSGTAGVRRLELALPAAGGREAEFSGV